MVHLHVIDRERRVGKEDNRSTKTERREKNNLAINASTIRTSIKTQQWYYEELIKMIDSKETKKLHVINSTFGFKNYQSHEFSPL